MRGGTLLLNSFRIHEHQLLKMVNDSDYSGIRNNCRHTDNCHQPETVPVRSVPPLEFVLKLPLIVGQRIRQVYECEKSQNFCRV